MKINRVFILISLFFLAGCDNTVPELKSAQLNTHDNNLQSNSLKDGDCYNKNPDRNAFLVIYMSTRAIRLTQLLEN